MRRRTHLYEKSSQNKVEIPVRIMKQWEVILVTLRRISKAVLIKKGWSKPSAVRCGPGIRLICDPNFYTMDRPAQDMSSQTLQTGFKNVLNVFDMFFFF